MPDSLARFIAGALIVVHGGLAVWAAVGFLELLFPEVPWSRVSNPLLSRGMLALHWALVGVAAGVFITGYVRRWKHGPPAMLIIYGAMALVCAYETFFILTSASRFRAMAIEYAEYAVILAFLFFAPQMRRRFGRAG